MKLRAWIAVAGMWLVMLPLIPFSLLDEGCQKFQAFLVWCVKDRRWSATLLRAGDAIDAWGWGDKRKRLRYGEQEDYR